MKKTLRLYKIQNKETFSEQSFETKDDFFTFLEFENHKVRLSNQSADYQIEYYENDNFINFKTIKLPFEETVEKYLEDFHLPKTHLNPKKEQVSTTDEEKNKKKPKNNLSRIGIIINNVLTILSMVMLIFGWHTVVTNQKEVNSVKQYFNDYMRKKAYLDTFSRYFLAAAYSEDYDSLTDFYLDGEILESNLKKGNVITVNLEDIEQDSESTSVTCLINVKDNHNVLFKRVSFEVGENEDSIYKYQAISSISDELISTKEVK